VGTINTASLLALHSVNGTAERLRKALRWIEDEDFVRSLILNKIPNQRKPFLLLPDTDIDLLKSIAKWTPAFDAEIFSRVFDIAEPSKIPPRRRMIIEPLLNDYIRKEHLLGIKLPSRKVIRRMVTRRYVYQLDASAFFDQFRVCKGLQPLCGIKKRDGSIFHQQVLGMGFRPACDVAQSAGEHLLAFSMPEVDAVCYIDNFIFASDDRLKLIAAVRQFLRRCSACGVVLNGLPSPLSDQNIEEHLESLVCEPEFDCLGEHYVCGPRGSRSCTASCMDKIAAVKATVLQQTDGLVSCRAMAAVFGIAFFASATLATKLCLFRPAYLAFAHLCKHAQTEGWTSTAPRMDPLALNSTWSWLEQLSNNTPQPLEQDLAYDTCIFVDASAWGYGAVVSSEAGSTSFISQQWTAGDYARLPLHHSTSAEPEAALRVLLQTVDPTRQTSVLLYTDHSALVYAGKRGYGRAPQYNEVLRRASELLPLCTIRWEFVAGLDNPADPYSRGRNARGN
jgi:hypothetical protein